jgi:hypothetical protein
MRLSLVALMLGIVSTIAAAQRGFGIVASDSGARMHRVADGVFAILHDDAVHSYPDGSISWPQGNTA